MINDKASCSETQDLGEFDKDVSRSDKGLTDNQLDKGFLSANPPAYDYLKLYQQNKLPEITMEKLICETQLLSLGNYFPTNFRIDTEQFQRELKPFQDKWTPYLPREGRLNDRQGLCLVGLEGDTYSDSLSIPEATQRTQRVLRESDFNVPTELYHQLPSLHPLFETFFPMGRSFLLRCNEAGWFPPHRDGKWIGRDTFRLVAFLANCGADDYDWILDGKKIDIVEGRVYYVNTRLTHKTFSMVPNSQHLIMNVPVTLENILKLISYC